MNGFDVILVDDEDNAVGVMEKYKAHLGGYLHRAFSVFIFNSRGLMLLQRRAFSKYHSGGLWTNACCSHPRLGESIENAASRRLKEEMGFECSLKKLFVFKYKADVGHGLIEHEIDHVFFGIYDGEVALNLEEAIDYKHLSINDIDKEIHTEPNQFTAWFKIAIDQVKLHLNLKLR